MLLVRRILNFGTVVAIAAVTAGAFAQSPAGSQQADSTLTRRLFDMLPWQPETQSAAQEALTAAKAAEEAAVAAQVAAEAAKKAREAAAVATAAAAPATATPPVTTTAITPPTPPDAATSNAAAASPPVTAPAVSVTTVPVTTVPIVTVPVTPVALPAPAEPAKIVEPLNEPLKVEPVKADAQPVVPGAQVPATTASLPAATADADDPPAPEEKDAKGNPKIPEIPAKKFFGAVKTAASDLEPRVFGGYAAGCLAGGVALKTETDKWQAMRLSRNRNWGHPKLIELLDRFATDMKTKEKWPGLLIGDLAQPRGGPMKSGHKSHQVGLDADIWFKPMPSKVLTHAERETYEPLLLAEDNGTSIITKNWNEGFVRLIRRAASYPEVERIFLHPAIKREFCKVTDTDRSWLKKVRPMWLHNYHFHVRMSCPAGSPGCVAQKAVDTTDDGCGKELDDWIKDVSRPPRVRDPNEPKKPSPKPWVLTLEKLPAQCREVITAGNPPEVKLPERTAVTKPAPGTTPAAATPGSEPAARGAVVPVKAEKSSSYVKPWKPKYAQSKYAQAKSKYVNPSYLGAKANANYRKPAVKSWYKQSYKKSAAR